MNLLKMFFWPGGGGLNITIWVLRLAAIPLFLAWPVVLFMSAFAFDDPRGNVAIRSTVVLIVLAYPLYISVLWGLATGLRESSPALALFLNAAPALFLAVILTWYGHSRMRDNTNYQARLVERDKLSTEIKNEIARGAYQDAFKNYRNGGPLGEEFLAEKLNFPKLINEIPLKKVNEELVALTLKFVSPGINGITSVHWRMEDRNQIFASTEMLNIVIRWKKDGLKIKSLSFPQQWLFDHIDLYEADQAKRKKITSLFNDENPVLPALLEHDYEQALARIPRLDEWINKKGKVYGTPLNAILIDNAITSFPDMKRTECLKRHGAELAPDEIINHAGH